MGTEGSNQGNGVKLVGQTGAYRGNSYFIEKDEFTVGRSAGSDLVINESTVSGKHAKLTRTADGFEIQDLGSTNGTFVNGVKIDRKPLRTDDKVKFDIYEFTYVNPGEVARTVVSQAPEFAEETAVRPQAAPPPPPPAPQPAAPEPQPAAPRPQPPAAAAAPSGPRVKPAAFERKGSMILGLIVGLILVDIISFGGPLVYALINNQFNMSFLDVLKGLTASFPYLHMHTAWMNVNWADAGVIVTIICLPLGILVGSIVMQTIGRKNRFLTALVFSIFYVGLMWLANFWAVNFNLDMMTMIAQGSANFVGDRWLNLALVDGYVFGVVFVISLIGCLLGRK